MSNFVWEPPTRLRVGEPLGRPRTARDLLSALGVESEPVEDQRKQVTKWVKDNHPDDLMRTSLRRTGLAYGFNVDRAEPSKLTVDDGTETVFELSGWATEPIYDFPKPFVELSVRTL